MSNSSFQIDKLHDDNYASWSIQMRSLLITQDYWDVIEIPISELASPQEKLAWKVRDKKALASITLAVRTSELIHLKDCKSSREAWSKLEQIYRAKDPARKVHLFKKFVRFKFVPDEKYSVQINKFCSIADDLKDADINIPSELLSIFLLCSLPPELENFVIAIESRDSLPNLEQLKNKIFEEEQRRSEKMNVGDDHVLAIKHKNKNFNNKIQNYQNKFKNVKCYGCGKKGHLRSQCQLKNKTGNQECAMFIINSCINDDNLNEWLLDSGASSHVCRDKHLFTGMKEYNSDVILASGDKFCVKGIGNVKVKFYNNCYDLKDVLYIPNMKSNFLSVSKMAEKGYTIKFQNNNVEIFKKNEFQFKSRLFNGIYKIKSTMEKPSINNVENCDNTLWHRRFGHLNYNDLNKLVSKEMVRGIKGRVKEFNCVTCSLCKMTIKPFKAIGTTSSYNLLELVHTDICGPMRNKSYGGAFYFITFIDDFSRYITVYLLKNKSDAFNAFKEFLNMAEKQTGNKLKRLRSDNGREYINANFNSFLNERGIVHETTVSYTPQQNGISERANRTLVEMTRCMLEESKLPKSLWAEAISTSVYIKNRSPTKVLENITPYEKWNGRKPSVSYFKTFGCKAIVLEKKPGRSKLEPKGKICTFVGYQPNTKGYRLFDLKTNKIIVSRDVKFFENEFENKHIQLEDFCNTLDYSDILNKQNRSVENSITNKNFINDSISENDIENENILENQDADEHESSHSSEESDFLGFYDSNQESELDETYVTNYNGRRKRGRPKILRTGKPGRPSKIYKMSTEELNLVNDFTFDPESVKQALNRPDSEKWQEAMSKEYSSLIKNNTWELVDKPADKNVIGCKWIFTKKRFANGAVEKYKARLVAQGCFQKYNEDYYETYAPVIRHPTIRLVLSMAVKYKLLIKHVDVVAAYLNGDLKEDVYMKQPEMFVKKGQENLVCKLKKSLYGLKQAGRAWNNKISEILLKIGFVQCKTDSCVFVNRTKNEINIITLYVDDILLACTFSKSMENILEKLKEHVEIEDRGQANYYLGMEIIRHNPRGDIEVHQKNFVKELLKQWNMHDCKPAKTPFVTGTVLLKCEEENCKEMIEVKKYQSIIGSLMYLSTISRPDIAHTVSSLAQFGSHPHKEHMIAAKHVLRYLKHKEVSLNYTQEGSELICFSDADWGSNVNDRKSYSGFVLFFAGGPISWESKKQNIVALSSMEAEYIAMCQAVKEICFYRSLINEIGFQNLIKAPTVLCCDNQGAQFLTKNHITLKRSKHIDIRYHYIKEKYYANEIELKYVPTESNVADIFTKCLPNQNHIKCCNLLNLKF